MKQWWITGRTDKGFWSVLNRNEPETREVLLALTDSPARKAWAVSGKDRRRHLACH